MKTIQVDKEVLDKICEDLIPVIIYYQEAVERIKKLGVVGIDEELRRTAQQFEEKRKLYRDVSATIDSDEFWYMILKSKIEMIAAFGSLDLIKKVYHHLEKHEWNERYQLASTFSMSAQVIAGW